MYQVWLNARHPMTLEVVASALIYENDNRLCAEEVLERAHDEYPDVVAALRNIYPEAIVNASMKYPQSGMSLQFDRLEQARQSLFKM